MAATVEPIQGQVSLNRGSGFRVIASETIGHPGEIVMARQNSRARVVYPDGCFVMVNPGAVYTIAETSPCKDGAPLVAGETFAIGAAGVGIGVGVYFLTKSRSSSP